MSAKSKDALSGNRSVKLADLPPSASRKQAPGNHASSLQEPVGAATLKLYLYTRINGLMETLRAPARVLKKLNLRDLAHVNEKLRKGSLHTVCEEARCPNISECWSRPTATFMVLGNVCTRGCNFCSVAGGKPLALDPHEPEHLAETAAQMDLKYVVITSVNRDDLKDGGSEHFAACISAVRRRLPECKIEVLTPDFRRKTGALETIIESGPDVFNHNLETVPRLYRPVRPGAVYEESLALLKRAKELGAPVTKTGIMVGLGEQRDEVLALMDDAREHDIEVMTIGQYLRPTRDSLEVVEYVDDETFAFYREEGMRRGFHLVAAGTHVRSSYLADLVFESAENAKAFPLIAQSSDHNSKRA